MATDLLRFRQIHLDFHTHESIEGIGADFDPDQFGDVLQAAHVDSINLFARGHHGYIYYETERFPERRHPNLQCNLLAQQIEACHKRDIKAPIYVTVQWDAYTAEHHPEWLVRDPEGKGGNPCFSPGFYGFLCLNTPYVDWLETFVADVLEKLPVDGFWFDIVMPQECSCRWCRAGMLAEGMDPADATARRTYGIEVLRRFKRRMTAFVRQHNQDCLIFYNAGHVGPLHRPVLDAYTHLELESLPTGGWGYMHFPVTARYARSLGLDFLGMTGKFHTSWGDFHSFKNEDALTFECLRMLALNAKCCIGDQLHPRGSICPYTYKLVGKAYAEVAKREAWCTGTTPVVDIGVLTPEEFSPDGRHTGLPKASMGVARILEETQHQFDIIDSHSDFAGYRVLILPDEVPVNPTLAAKLNAYVEAGGCILASHRAGLTPDGKQFAIPLGVRYQGDAPFTPMFVQPGEALLTGLNPTAYVMYETGTAATAESESTILATNIAPYFNRTWKHYCSHQHAPSSGQECGPAIVRSGNVIYMAQPVFSQYQKNAPRWCRQLVKNALELLLPDPVLRVGGPSTLVATVNHKHDTSQHIIHLLHYVPVRNNDTLDTIGDVYPLHDLEVSLRIEGQIQSVYLVPEGEALAFSRQDGYVTVRVPRLEGVQLIAVTTSA